MRKLKNMVKLVAGPVWHESLTLPQTSRIHVVHQTIGRDVLGPFEHFEARFLREMRVDDEIAIYERIVKAFVAWKAHADVDLNAQKLALAQMISYTLNKRTVRKIWRSVLRNNEKKTPIFWSVPVGTANFAKSAQRTKDDVL